ncbi:minor extracellular protease vpr [Colletotrichum spaethianum]|uniref:Minor extracellular protease vpr n=1 Tax=Colletotrichum spaethianum TaxID=700344 RepID=A0AA37PF19_9PEZI|nr:minor extracellular protease vpr [Colletotrichum spaethianum]GKT51113.1 minor extracellular protease vpr [Colletotrichum spaethianum]
MQLSRLLLTVTGVVSAIAHRDHPLMRRADDNAPDTAANKTTVEPKRFIVEFDKGTNAAAVAADIVNQRGAKILRVFRSDIFTGAVVETGVENIDSLQALAPVKEAWQSRKLKLAPSAPLASFSKNATAIDYDIHHMTGVDKLHEAGVLGKGAKVAVVDSGIWYTHEALGGGFGEGFKVAGGYDFVGDGSWPNEGEVKSPDADPLDQQGHGTHVAGIIAGNSSVFTGVAPEATLYAYKVFSSVDGTDEDTLIEAFLAAYDAGVDIITSSIGGVNGFADNAWAVVASRLVDQGVVVTISSGNDGQGGAFAASSGSSGEHVVAVASIEADVLASSSFRGVFNLDGQSNETRVAYRAMEDWFPSEVKDWPIFPLGLNTSAADEACNPLPAGTPDFTGVVALVRRGGCNFDQKQRNLAAFNASHILFYSNEMPLVRPTTQDTSSLIAMVDARVGIAIIDTIKAGGNVTADFTERPIYHIVGIKNEENGGVASQFTSIGATNDLFIKPDIAAPGGQILSSYVGGGYAILSGTSMSCPYVAGIAALYVSKFGGRSVHGPEWAKRLVMRLIASGDAITWDDGQLENNQYDFLAPVAQVGAGLINASKVLEYETSLSFAKFALNDTHHFSRYHTVDITNTGSQPVTYAFAQQESGGMNTVNLDPNEWGTPKIAWFEETMVAPQKMTPRISFPGGSFTVQPGETRTAQFNFKYPENQDLDPAKLPLYSGKVLIKGSNGETLGVPYLGLAADLHKDVGIMFQYPIGFPRITSTRRNIPIADKSNFTFNLDPAVQDFPNLYARIQYATRELRWDIFEASWVERDWKYPPVVGQAGFVGAATSWAKASGKVFIDPSVDDRNDIVTLPMRDVPRDIVGVYGVELWWLGRLANGTQIAPGKYKMRFAALVPFGNPEASDNWDIFETPAFEVLPLEV